MQTLHEAFLDAFSDYAIDMQLSLERFSDLISGNGFDPDTSVGAWEGDVLIGFVFCALRNYNGMRTLYDCGTGTRPQFRGRGIAAAMFSALKQEMHADRFLLEVLTDNTPAVALYRKQGFSIIRELTCFRCERHRIRADAVMPVTLTDSFPTVYLAQAQGLWDFAPTWQNSTATVLQDESERRFAFVADGVFLLGYGVVNPRNGALMQLAVMPGYRGLHIGSTLLYALVTSSTAGSICAINVDVRDTVFQAALARWGFSKYATQYEMQLLFH